MTFDESATWCCPGFKSAIQNAGNRGFGVFVDDTAEPVMFVLQYRALDPGAPVPKYDGPMGIISNIGIRFCPWCGKDLLKAYRRQLKQLAREDLVIKLA